MAPAPPTIAGRGPRRAKAVPSAISSVMRIVSLLGLGGLFIASCLPPRQPQPDPDAMVGHDNRLPACITAALEERYAACPERRLASGRAVVCTPADGSSHEPEMPTRALLVDTSLRPEEHQLERAETAIEAAAASRNEPHARHAERLLRRTVASLRGQPAFGYASYRLGHLLHERGKDQAALAALAEAITFAMGRAALPADEALAQRARSDYVALFAVVGDAAEADRAFTPLSPFRKTAPMLAELAGHLAAAGRSSDLERVMRQLALRDPDRRCSHHARILTLARAHGERRAVVHALNELLATYDQLEIHEPDRQACGAETARHLLELADEWRREGLGEPRTSSALPTIHLAEQLYRRVVATFTQEQLAGWGLCVDLADISRHRGELLARQGDWRECGRAYDDALGLAPTAPWAPEVAYDAVICRQRSWTRAQERRTDMPTEERIERSLQHTEDWKRMLAAFHRYLCNTPASDSRAERADTALLRAQAFFEGGALWESAVGFRLAAFAEPRSNVRQQAMRRYAEVTEALAMDDTCRIELRADLDHLMRELCPTNGADAHCTATRQVYQRLEPEQL